MISAAGPELLRPREDLRRVGERFARVWHYQCQGLSPACGARGLILSRGRRNDRPEALITRASQAKITLSLVSFTVVLRNVTQCFMMSPPPPPPPPPVLLGEVSRENKRTTANETTLTFSILKETN